MGANTLLPHLALLLSTVVRTTRRMCAPWRIVPTLYTVRAETGATTPRDEAGLVAAALVNSLGGRRSRDDRRHDNETESEC